WALVGLEAILLVDANPGQLLAPPGQFVATPCQRLFGLQQLQPGRKPLLTCCGLVIGHCLSPSCWCNGFGVWGGTPLMIRRRRLGNSRLIHAVLRCRCRCRCRSGLNCSEPIVGWCGVLVSP